GRFGQARQFLTQARAAQIAAAQEALKLRDKAQAAADAQLLGAAASTATEGGIAMTERHYGEAADLFKQAAALVPQGHRDTTSEYLRREAIALFQQGNELGDNSALLNSITIWKEVLQIDTRDRVPLKWAEAQMSLGVAFWKLGERESEPRRLVEAVATFRLALQEATGERAPLQWVETQYNLGSTLVFLGERSPGTERLEEAVSVFRL